MPKISVIIPSYKRPHLLLRAIESVQKQDFKDLELIVSDDNSNDQTALLVANLQKEDSRIKYVLNQNYKQGPNGNKNNGLDYACGEFISFLDDDDELLLKESLSILIRKAEQGYDHVFGNCLIQRDQELSTEFSGKGLNCSQEVSKKDFLMQKFSGEFFSVFKKDLLENKRFSEEFYGNEATLWVHLYDKKSFYIHKALRIYRINREDSVTFLASKNAFRVYLGYLQMARILEEEFMRSKDKDYLKICAREYKMAAYYAKLACEYKKMYFCLFKSLKVQMNTPALILLILSPVPNTFLKFLSKIRVSICKN